MYDPIVALRVPPKIFKYLKDEAKRRETTISQVIRMLLLKQLEPTKHDPKS